MPQIKFLSELSFTGLSFTGLSEADTGRVFSWDMVSRIHRSRRGIYQRNGRLISLLTDFGRLNPCYPDFHGESSEIIHYTGAGRRGDQKLDALNRSLLNAAETGHLVPLFNKLKVGHWEFLGFWQVCDGKYVYDGARQRMVWKFTLKRVSPE